jgi:hypothetical protein
MVAYRVSPEREPCDRGDGHKAVIRILGTHNFKGAIERSGTEIIAIER